MTQTIRPLVRSLGVLALLMAGMNPARADLIDFESGFTDQQTVGTVSTLTNGVTFSIQSGMTFTNAFIAQQGAPVLTAFVQNDTPATNAPGAFFLTDENGEGLDVRGVYRMQFALPVFDLSLDTIDFRDDGGAMVGDQVLLEVFSDANFTNLIGSDSFAVVNGLANGAVQSLAVLNPLGHILSARVRHSRGGNNVGNVDIGTAIDNIQFRTTPAPAGLPLFGIGLAGVLGYGWRRRKQEV
jgi:hypothetical protein